MPHRYRGGRLLHALPREHPRGHRRPPHRLRRGQPHGARPQRLSGTPPPVLSRYPDYRQQEDLRHDGRLLPPHHRPSRGQRFTRRHPLSRHLSAPVCPHPDGPLARDHDDALRPVGSRRLCCGVAAAPGPLQRRRLRLLRCPQRRLRRRADELRRVLARDDALLLQHRRQVRHSRPDGSEEARWRQGRLYLRHPRPRLAPVRRKSHRHLRPPLKVRG